MLVHVCTTMHNPFLEDLGLVCYCLNSQHPLIRLRPQAVKALNWSLGGSFQKIMKYLELYLNHNEYLEADVSISFHDIPIFPEYHGNVIWECQCPFCQLNDELEPTDFPLRFFGRSSNLFVPLKSPVTARNLGSWSSLLRYNF